MEKSVYDKISKVWNNCKLGKQDCPKVIPSVYYAINENNDIYYVAKDYSTIVYLVNVHDSKPYTYVIPKKYLKIRELEDRKEYFITKMSKLDLVSCSNKQVNDFDLFVTQNIISKIVSK